MIEATVENMRKYEDVQGIFAYSPVTAERYSATPGDYFYFEDGDVLKDEDGCPMILAVEECRVREL